MHRYQIATNKYRTYCKKDTTGGETELQTEQDRENKRHTYEGGISCHHHIFLEASQCARHLYGSGKKYSPVELKDQCKKHGKKYAQRGRKVFFKIQDSWTLLCCHIYVLLTVVLRNILRSFRHADGSDSLYCCFR